ncbi:MAG: hypothetical protein WCC36_18500 [Gammaproteobacteria bacterium]
MLHIFLYLVENLEDPFEGLKYSLSDGGRAGEVMLDIRLSPDEYQLVRRVEYSGRKYIRTLYYQKLFKNLERRIKKAVASVPREQTVFVYLSDEGVWAEFLRQVLSRAGRSVYTVNVQHGFFLLERQYLEQKWSVALRTLINSIVTRLLGYPLLGLAFGRGRCDVYLCYGERERAFLLAEGNELVYAGARLIKHNFISRYEKARKECDGVPAKPALLIAMPACVPGTEFKCGLEQFINTIAPAVEYIEDILGWEIIMRFHPGRDAEECRTTLQRTRLKDRVEIDRARDVVDSMARCGAVMAAHSTVLFEASLLGKVPIAIRSDCFRRPLHYAHEAVDMSAAFDDQLASALSAGVRAKYSAMGGVEQLNWASLVGQLPQKLEDTRKRMTEQGKRERRR